MSLITQGPTGVFDNTSGTITRLCDIEFIAATTTFSDLAFNFPSGEPTELAGAALFAVSWPNAARIQIRQVKRFAVATGMVLVHFHKHKSPP